MLPVIVSYAEKNFVNFAVLSDTEIQKRIQAAEFFVKVGFFHEARKSEISFDIHPGYKFKHFHKSASPFSLCYFTLFYLFYAVKSVIKCRTEKLFLYCAVLFIKTEKKGISQRFHFNYIDGKKCL